MSGPLTMRSLIAAAALLTVLTLMVARSLPIPDVPAALPIGGAGALLFETVSL